MTTFNTGNPIGSTDARDLSDNAENFDTALNSTAETWNDRLGVTRDTFEGALSKLSFYRVSTFAAGYTLTNMRQTLEYGGHEYSWAGTFPKVVAAGATPATSGGIGAGAWVDRTDETLRGELTDATGSYLIGNGAGTIGDEINSARPLSYYGNNAAALTLLLAYAKATGLPIKLTSSVQVDSTISIDFEGSDLIFFFNGFSILSDITALSLSNLGIGSKIYEPSMLNVTAPWAVTYWDANGEWLSDAAAAATLTQTNDPGYFMPTVNHVEIWAEMTEVQKAQTISSKLLISNSIGVKIYNPSGRYCLYEFDNCHMCEVFNPQIQSGGLGTFGTILFKNLSTTGYGIGNFVHGGSVNYGSFSGVVFVRNKHGGVDGGFIPFRCGESGVKTFQNEVAGRSARCYDMRFSDIFPRQTVFDGVDFNSDYGDTPVERVDDYTLASYGWHQLPTRHVVFNIESTGCKQVGVWGDGSQNSYKEILAKDGNISGIKLFVYDSEISCATAIECNKSNTASGEHQITIPFNGNVVNNPVTITSSAITAGYAIFAPNSTIINGRTIGSRTVSRALSYGHTKASSVEIGSDSAYEDSVVINMKPRGANLTNPTGVIRGKLTTGSPGSESGNLELRPFISGVESNGIRVIGNLGGFGAIGIATTSAYSDLIENGELYFYQSGTSVILACKLADGTIKTATVIA